MAWNEPGGGKDPWGGGGGGQNNGPPDLDEALKKLREKLGFLGGGGSGGVNGFKFLPVILVIILVIWAFSGIYQVDETERAVVLRLGKYHATVNPGLHWNPPLVDSVTKVEVTEVRQYRNNNRDLMLTEDENIVDLQLVVQFNVPDPKAFVLNVKDPETSLRHATNSALRHVVGSSKLDSVISSGREQVGVEVKERLQRYLDIYDTGIEIIQVNIQDAKPPAQVQAAYDDVIKAREDQERVVSEAQSYSNAVIPEARGRAQRILEEADAYQARVIAEAEGEADRFVHLFTEYEKSPEVTRQRLYLDAMEAVMSNSSKVMVAAKDGNNILYLPLDKAVGGGTSATATPGSRLSPAQMSTIADEVLNRMGNQSGSGSQRRELR
ncbi:MAG: FtsH protease activity modulator HflK [Porticoccaceae bacterium]|nr:FtsH protease activity modulator HflK [Porticoccaceae bacterium]